MKELKKCSFFGSFIPIPKGTYSVKELGVCTLRARFAGGKAPTNKKLKNFQCIQKQIYFVIEVFSSTFSRLRGADFVKVFTLRVRFAKVQFI